MSETETHKGRLVIFNRLQNEADSDYLMRALQDHQKGAFKSETWEEYKNIPEYIGEEGIEDVICYNNTIYINTNHLQLDSDDGITIGNKSDLGIDYLVRFYNGGACLSEMLEEVLEITNK